MNFKQKYGNWALISGATSGIGEELANQLAAKGLNIALVARKEKELIEKSAYLMDTYGVQTKCIAADISNQEGIEKVKSEAKDLEVGLLVLAAGLEVNGAFEKNNVDRELQVIQLNVVATMQLTHHFIAPMVQRKTGGVIMISSLSGHMPNPYFANYAGTKAFVLNFGASLYGELLPKGVDVTVLSPGLTKTPMIKDNGVDFSKTPMSAMEPSLVAKKAIDSLGKKFLAIPGGKNNIMAAMAKHSPLQMQAKMNEKMMRKAMNPAKI